MSGYDIIRAWKDEDYLESLSEEQRSQLPENPAGIVEMSDDDMENVAGGGSKYYCGGGSYYNCDNDDNTNTYGEACVCNSNGDNCDNSFGDCPTFGFC